MKRKGHFDRIHVDSDIEVSKIQSLLWIFLVELMYFCRYQSCTNVGLRYNWKSVCEKNPVFKE